jgi:hypothetical protein
MVQTNSCVLFLYNGNKATEKETICESMQIMQFKYSKKRTLEQCLRRQGKRVILSTH